MGWRDMAELKRSQRYAVKCCMVNRVDEIPALPLTITITRIGPTNLDDDNLASACKYVRDQIADTIGTDDGSPLYTWKYAQHVGKKGEHRVYVEIVRRGGEQ